MAKNPLPIPSTMQRVVQAPQGILDPLYYQFLAQMFAVVSEQSAQIEALRVALNEVRADPTTVYPAVPAF